MYEIIRSDRLNKIRDSMELIDQECFEQFVVGVISWYQNEITHPTIPFNETPDWAKPPNIFHLFEHPNLYAETIFNLFVESDARFFMKERGMDHRHARDNAIDTFNNSNAEYWDHMRCDTEHVLNGYHLFYCYQDDARDETSYYNPYVKEVW
jgi:hypothetical protein